MIIAHPDAFAFASIIGKWALDSDRSGFVTSGTPEYYRVCARFVVVRDGIIRAACAVQPDGELVSVVRLEWGSKDDVAACIRAAIDTGKVKYLCCYDGKLPAIYRKFGFVEQDRGPWMDELAPWGWNYRRDGRPDYLTMRLEVSK